MKQKILSSTFFFFQVQLQEVVGGNLYGGVASFLDERSSLKTSTQSSFWQP